MTALRALQSPNPCWSVGHKDAILYCSLRPVVKRDAVALVANLNAPCHINLTSYAASELRAGVVNWQPLVGEKRGAKPGTLHELFRVADYRL